MNQSNEHTMNQVSPATAATHLLVREAAGALRGAADRFSAWLRRRLAERRMRRQQARTIATLRGLSDTVLRDIGMHRSGIAAAARAHCRSRDD